MDTKTGTPLAIGAAIGGVAGQQMFKIVRGLFPIRTSGCASFAFQGGEPTLRGLDFYKALASYEKRFNKNEAKIANAIQTNGYLIDDAWCDFLAENHFLVGVSVDGTREVHDALRRDAAGRCTFDRICQNIKRMNAHKVEYNILTVVTVDIAHSAREVYELYLLGNFNDDTLPVLDDRRKVIAFIERLKKVPADCFRCKYLGLCRVGCMRNRVLDERTGEYKNKFCEAYKMFFDACGGRLKKVCEVLSAEKK